MSCELAEDSEQLIDAEQYVLGMTDMDQTHRQFVVLVNLMHAADKIAFMELFPRLLLHTELHFRKEHEQMKLSRFPALAEHHADHERILGQLARFAERVKQGRLTMARAFVSEQLPDWFHTHIATMDSALAAHLKLVTLPADHFDTADF